jgi:exodeoxyribonuclease VII small subunit
MSTQNTQYQAALTRLEEILGAIDRSEVGIDELAVLVQEATQLIGVCRAVLTQTESEVSQALQTLEAN